MKKCAYLITLVWLISGCGNQSAIVDRKLHWESAIDDANLIGKSSDAINTWIDEALTDVAEYSAGDVLFLETFEGNSPVCSTWQIFVTFEFDKDGKISDFDLNDAGNCL